MSLKSTTSVAYPVQAVLLSCFITLKRWIVESEPILKGFLPTTFETSVESDAELHFMTNSVHYWVISSDEAPLEAALTPLEHINLAALKMFLIREALSDLLASTHASGRTPFQV